MTERICEREALVAATARSGAWSAELKEHVAGCAACVETKRVAQLLLGQAPGMPPIQLPSANLVWQRVQARRQQIALRRAQRCMTLMYVMAAVYAVALAGWSLPRLWRGQVAADLSMLSGGVVLAGVLTAICAVLLGSCCFAFLGSRTDFRLRS